MATTWQRFFNPHESVFALVAERDGQIVGLVHYLFHRSTIFLESTCYLARIAVCERAQQAGASRVYWHTHESNAAGRMLYDKVAQHLGFIVYTRNL
jgi:hypothetical protein